VTLTPGLCSVTMRHLGIEEVAKLAAEAGLTAIEWGGDVHVPSGDIDAAKRARVACTAAGLVCASYGSYLLADGDSSTAVIASALDTAVALGAPNVRVWTPFGVEPGSPRTGEVVDGLARVSDEAATRHLTVGIEFHGGTLTATAESAASMLDAVGAPNLSTYWQPPYWGSDRSPADDAAEVLGLGSRLSHVHVYEWAGAEDRRPLAAGTRRWRAVFDALADTDQSSRCAFLEFVADDDPRALLRDAQTLHELLGDPA